MKVFVYGTLKRGFRLNPVLSNSFFVGETIVEGYDMFSLGAFPAIKSGEGSVHGEVYEVDERTLSVLDQIEGVPHLYVRQKIQTPLGECFAYIMEDADQYEKIDGIWK